MDAPETENIEEKDPTGKREDLSVPVPPAPLHPTSPTLKNLPHKPGIYLMRDKTGAILYIGKAVDLRKRAANYFRAGGLGTKINALVSDIRHIDFIVAESEREALIIEQRLIKRHQPIYNTMWRDDKSYPWVRISLNEDFPRISLTRRRTRDGARYFGPYPHVSYVKRLLYWIWRKHLFPLRPCKLEFSEGRLPPPKKVQSCLYLHTRECPAPCLAQITRRDYRKIAERAVLFFEGKHGTLRRAWELEMRGAAKALDFEKAAKLRDNIEALDHIRERVTFRAIRPEDVQSRIEGTGAVQALQTALGLAKPPLRIEAFDISHFQAAETVASMVTFYNGKPLKSHYRKYIIRTVTGVDDFKSMQEVVSRRYRRVKAEKLPWPDLVLIDGGPGQLSAAISALETLEIRRLPIAALAKQEEEIFLPGRKEPVRLAKDSPALQMLQHVRDESHRFAVTFHRLRRDKSTFQSSTEVVK